MYDQLMDAYKANKAAGGSGERFWGWLRRFRGFMCLPFYDVAYNEDGTIASFGPNRVVHRL